MIDSCLMGAHRRDTIVASTTSSGVTDGQNVGRGWVSRPLGKINSKTGSPSADILILSILVVLRSCCQGCRG